MVGIGLGESGTSAGQLWILVRMTGAVSWRLGYS